MKNTCSDIVRCFRLAGNAAQFSQVLGIEDDNKLYVNGGGVSTDCIILMEIFKSPNRTDVCLIFITYFSGTLLI